MDLLTIQDEDFTMYVECTKFDAIWNKAKGNVGEEKSRIYLYLVGGGIGSKEK